MKRFVSIFAVLSVSLTFAYSDVQSDLKTAEKLHKEFKYADEKKTLLSGLEAARTPKEKSEVTWRLSRVTLNLGDDAEDQGAKKEDLLKIFEEGEKYANQSIESFPNNPLAYYWKSANIGRWGQVKGIFDSLGKAEPMQKLLIQAIELDSDHADSYFVLGELYDELPGWPISFGNIDFAVSFARKSIAINEAQVGFGKVEKHWSYYVKLAKHLYKRNWDAAKRKSEQKGKLDNYNSKRSILEKNGYFEGNVSIEPVPDRDEAKAVIASVIKGLEEITTRNKTQNDDLKDAKDISKGW